MPKGSFESKREYFAAEKKAIEAAKVLHEFCEKMVMCQNCIFRKHGGDLWECHLERIKFLDMRDIEENKQAKRKKGGYI